MEKSRKIDLDTAMDMMDDFDEYSDEDLPGEEVVIASSNEDDDEDSQSSDTDGPQLDSLDTNGPQLDSLDAEAVNFVLNSGKPPKIVENPQAPKTVKTPKMPRKTKSGNESPEHTPAKRGRKVNNPFLEPVTIDRAPRGAPKNAPRRAPKNASKNTPKQKKSRGRPPIRKPSLPPAEEANEVVEDVELPVKTPVKTLSKKGGMSQLDSIFNEFARFANISKKLVPYKICYELFMASMTKASQDRNLHSNAIVVSTEAVQAFQKDFSYILELIVEKFIQNGIISSKVQVFNICEAMNIDVQPWVIHDPSKGKDEIQFEPTKFMCLRNKFSLNYNRFRYDNSTSLVIPSPNNHLAFCDIPDPETERKHVPKFDDKKMLM